MFAELRGLFRNWVSIVGAVITSAAAVIFLAVFLLDLFGYHSNPYIGIFFSPFIPPIFLFGLLLTPIGLALGRRRRRAGHAPSEVHWPRLDLNDPRTRHIAFGVAVLTVVNVLIVSLAAYRGVE